MNNAIATAADIYLEINGIKAAVVQSYTAAIRQESRVVQALGQRQPVAAVRGPETYTITLSRLYATDEAIRDGIRFYDLSDFSLVICKPDRQIIYSGCQWQSLRESADLGDCVLEEVVILAAQRIETEVGI